MIRPPIPKKPSPKISECSPIKAWIAEERPRELLFEGGAESLPPAKLLAIILRTGGAGVSAEELSRRLLNRFSTLRNLDANAPGEICRIKGIGPAKAAQLKAAFELGKRLCREKVRKQESIKSPEAAIHYVSSLYGPYLRDQERELFCLILLDAKNKPLKSLEITRGTVRSAMVSPREVVREAILRNASSLLLVHNHPSGDATPSAEDVAITRRIGEACRFFEISILDHIIIGKNREDYFSLRKSGLI